MLLKYWSGYKKYKD